MGKKLYQTKSSSNICQNNKTLKKSSSASNLQEKQTFKKQKAQKIAFKKYKQQISQQNTKKIHKQNKQNKIQYNSLFKSTNGINVSLSQLDILCHHSMKTKSYGITLLNDKGLFIFVNKPGYQLFEGCLNNFYRHKFLDMIITSQTPSIAEALSSNFQSIIIKYCIYSKNSKRKYMNIQQKNESKIDEYLYFKYVKSIISRIRPIYIQFDSNQNYKNINGFWNENYISDFKNNDKTQEKILLYLMESKLQSEVPNIKNLELTSDERIKKFQQSHQTRKLKESLKSQNKLSSSKQNVINTTMKKSYQNKFKDSKKMSVGRNSNTRSLCNQN